MAWTHAPRAAVVATRSDIVVAILKKAPAAAAPDGAPKDVPAAIGVELEGEVVDAATAQRLGYRSLRSTADVDCAERRDRVLRLEVYAAHGLKGPHHPLQPPGTWALPTTGAYMHAVIASVCGAGRTRTDEEIRLAQAVLARPGDRALAAAAPVPAPPASPDAPVPGGPERSPPPPPQPKPPPAPTAPPPPAATPPTPAPPPPAGPPPTPEPKSTAPVQTQPASPAPEQAPAAGPPSPSQPNQPEPQAANAPKRAPASAAPAPPAAAKARTPSKPKPPATTLATAPTASAPDAPPPSSPPMVVASNTPTPPAPAAAPADASPPSQTDPPPAPALRGPEPLAAPPTPAPHPQPTHKPRPGAPSLTAQLGALDTEAAARERITTLKLPTDLTGAVGKIQLHGKTFYRALITGFPNFAAASAFCNRMHASNRDCWVH
jgi:hypothetical protein